MAAGGRAPELRVLLCLGALLARWVTAGKEGRGRDRPRKVEFSQAAMGRGPQGTRFPPTPPGPAAALLPLPAGIFPGLPGLQRRVQGEAIFFLLLLPLSLWFYPVHTQRLPLYFLSSFSLPKVELYTCNLWISPACLTWALRAVSFSFTFFFLL
jgi:hypothetical protein